MQQGKTVGVNGLTGTKVNNKKHCDRQQEFEREVSGKTYNPYAISERHEKGGRQVICYPNNTL